MSKYIFLCFFIFNISPLFAKEDDLFIKTIILMISDYMEVDIKEENLLFSDVLENKNIWTSTIKYEDNNFLILIDNIDLFVILINKNEIVVLFKGEPFPPPWDVYPYDKRWIYSYFRFR